MNKRDKLAGGLYKRVFLSFFFALIMNAGGIVFLYYDFYRGLLGSVSHSVDRAIHTLDKVLSYAELANTSVLEKNDGVCNTSLYLLREQVTLTPFVRTIEMASSGQLYCSSLLGELSARENSELYQEGRLRLIPGSSINKHRPFVVVRGTKNQHSALSSVDGLYIKMILSSLSNNMLLYFKVGGVGLDARGSFHKAEPGNEAFISSQKRSSKQPYSILAEVSHDLAWHNFKHNYLFLMLVLHVFSLLVGVFFFSLYDRPKSFKKMLRLGLQEYEFIPYFQPLVDAKQKKIIGVEVLMRWQHPQNGLIRPDLFIPQAEQCGLIMDMTSLLFKDVAMYFNVNRELFPEGFHIAINISAAHLEGDRILNDCAFFQRYCGDAKWQLVLELTERTVLNDTPDVISRIDSLISKGVAFALDDFGTGHSSLAILQKINFHFIKIDKSFISRIGEAEASQHIVDGVITLAKSMGLELVAEGVETTAQANYLSEQNVDYLQGYLYAAPMTPKDFLLYMQEH